MMVQAKKIYIKSLQVKKLLSFFWDEGRESQ